MAKKNKRQERPEDYKAHIGMFGFRNTEETIAALRGMDESSFNLGRLDKKSGRAAVTFLDFATDDGYDEFTAVPPAMKAAIIRANYAAYLDGYHGREFREHIICEKE